jgi:hypothetical protein
MAEAIKQIAIMRIGPISSRNPDKPASITTTDFLIEAMTREGPAHLSLSRDAVLVLAEELERWLKAHGFR